MKKYSAIGFLVLGLFCACSLGPKNLEAFMVEVSEFNINDTILKDMDYVRILGSSGNLTREHEIDFYTLIVVKSEKTGDTINILTTNFYEADLNNSRTRFISNSSTIGKLLEDAKNFDQFDGTNINDMKAKSYNKVFYDTEYIQVDVRKYPAITGNLGDYKIKGDINGFNNL